MVAPVLKMEISLCEEFCWLNKLEGCRKLASEHGNWSKRRQGLYQILIFKKNNLENWGKSQMIHINGHSKMAFCSKLMKEKKKSKSKTKTIWLFLSWNVTSVFFENFKFFLCKQKQLVCFFCLDNIQIKLFCLSLFPLLSASTIDTK